jgi:hypothetical protein
MSAKNALILICDVTGSMGEQGKIMLSRNLITYLRQQVRYGGEVGSVLSLRLLIWGRETFWVEFQEDEDLAAIETKGAATAQPLLDALQICTAEPCRLLLLSDGHVGRSELARLRVWRESTPHVSLRVIAVGADANVAGLAKIASHSRVFLPEEVCEILDPWPLEEPGAFPSRIGDLQWSNPQEAD